MKTVMEEGEADGRLMGGQADGTGTMRRGTVCSFCLSVLAMGMFLVCARCMVIGETRQLQNRGRV
jgi:hypothetical protein